MPIFEHGEAALDGASLDLGACEGKTDFSVPCKQICEQGPGLTEEIQTFRSTTYDITVSTTGKVDVNGSSRHLVEPEPADVLDVLEVIEAVEAVLPH